MYLTRELKSHAMEVSIHWIWPPHFAGDVPTPLAGVGGFGCLNPRTPSPPPTIKTSWRPLADPPAGFRGGKLSPRKTQLSIDYCPPS